MSESDYDGRPRSLQELADLAVVHIDFRSASLNAMIHSCEKLLSQAREWIAEGDLETACILLIRAAKLTIEDLPNRHPQWKTVESSKRKRIQNTGHEALSLLSDIKPRISDRYEAWRTSHPPQPAKAPPSPKPKKLVRRSRASSRASDASERGSTGTIFPRPDVDTLAQSFEYMPLPSGEFRPPSPVQPRRLVMPPHMLATGGSMAPEKMSAHQRQQGYANNAYSAPTRSHISYPSLERPPPQEQPQIWRSQSLMSVPRPPRPPKVRAGDALISSSKLGKATTEAGFPLRDMLCPSDLIDSFTALSSNATDRNCETCGFLLGTLTDDLFQIKVLLVPKQRGTPDTCETTDEEAIFAFQDARDLQTLGWIHTHPRQSCFLSSLDLHTHYGNQQMLAESVAIVCAPRKSPSVGVFRLTDPPGLGIIGNCREPGAFHPHPSAAIYTDAGAEELGHFHLVKGLPLEVVDLRERR